MAGAPAVPADSLGAIVAVSAMAAVPALVSAASAIASVASGDDYRIYTNLVAYLLKKGAYNIPVVFIVKLR